jgi:hypothetical protein
VRDTEKTRKYLAELRKRSKQLRQTSGRLREQAREVVDYIEGKKKATQKKKT